MIQIRNTRQGFACFPQTTYISGAQRPRLPNRFSARTEDHISIPLRMNNCIKFRITASDLDAPLNNGSLFDTKHVGHDLSCNKRILSDF